MERDMKISCIILNYNDAKTTEMLVKRFREYQVLNSIVIVDNCSTDDSVKILKELKEEKVHLIHTRKNGGYGYGNNQGIRYAVTKLHATHVLIANPDVEVSESCIKAMKQAFFKYDRLAVAAAVTRNPEGFPQPSGWKLHGLLGDMLDTGLITRRLFHGVLNYSLRHFKDRSHAFVDAVPGSLFLADAGALMKCGLYDQEVFLYYEEKILGYKLKKKGYRTVLLLDEHYIHHHSVSISKNIASIRKKQEILHESKLHYYKKYLRINPAEERLAKSALNFLLGEIWFLTEVLGMSWKT